MARFSFSINLDYVDSINPNQDNEIPLMISADTCERVLIKVKQQRLR